MFETGSSWTLNAGTGSLILAGGFLFVSTWLFLRSLKREQLGRTGYLIHGLRLFLALLVAVTLLRPEQVVLQRHQIQPRVTVLWDASGSMATKDVESSSKVATSRADWVEAQRKRKFWSALEDRYKVEVAPLGAPPAKPAPGEILGTNLNRPLGELLKGESDLRAVLLLSDGDWNLGASPLSSATVCAQRQVPVFAVSVGSETFLPDIELQTVSAPAYGLVSERIAVMVRIQNRLPREIQTRVDIRGPTGLIGTKPVTLPPMGQVMESVLITPQEEGRARYEVIVPTEAEEVFADNNKRPFEMAIKQELLKVLVVDSVPRWEYRYLRNALARDPGVDLSCILWHPAMGAGQGRYYRPDFPSAKEDLSRYDVVFLGDVGIESGMLTEENAEMLKGLIEKQGSGLVFLPGPDGRQRSFPDSPLGDLLPVELDDKNAAGFAYKKEARLELTPLGRDHWLTLLATTAEENTRIWKTLPGFFWRAPVTRARLGADVLAHHAERSKRLPLLVIRPYGTGKVLWMGTDAAWRWRRGVEDTYHYRFWGQVVRWMAHQRHLAQAEGIRFFYSPESPRQGDRIFLNATILDTLGRPLSNAPVNAAITLPSSATQSVSLNAEEGEWGVFTGSFVAEEGGTLKLTIESKEAQRKLDTKIEVNVPTREKIGLPARPAVLREMAAVSGGVCGGTEDLDSIVKSIELLPEPKAEELRFRLWCHPYWCALLVVLFALYWTGRKLTGLF